MSKQNMILGSLELRFVENKRGNHFTSRWMHFWKKMRYPLPTLVTMM